MAIITFDGIQMRRYIEEHDANDYTSSEASCAILEVSLGSTANLFPAPGIFGIVTGNQEVVFYPTTSPLNRGSFVKFSGGNIGKTYNASLYTGKCQLKDSIIAASDKEDNPLPGDCVITSSDREDDQLLMLIAAELDPERIGHIDVENEELSVETKGDIEIANTAYFDHEMYVAARCNNTNSHIVIRYGKMAYCISPVYGLVAMPMNAYDMSDRLGTLFCSVEPELENAIRGYDRLVESQIIALFEDVAKILDKDKWTVAHDKGNKIFLLDKTKKEIIATFNPSERDHTFFRYLTYAIWKGNPNVKKIVSAWETARDHVTVEEIAEVLAAMQSEESPEQPASNTTKKTKAKRADKAPTAKKTTAKATKKPATEKPAAEGSIAKTTKKSATEKADKAPTAKKTAAKATKKPAAEEIAAEKKPEAEATAAGEG